MSSQAKMERTDSNDTKIPVDYDKKSDKIGSNVIECSVNMNVSLSRAKKSKLFQRAQSLLIVILAIIFAIVCSHLKREVRALEVQMNCANSNLMILMLRYDKLNQNFNRIWYHRHHRFFPDSLETRPAIGNPSRNEKASYGHIERSMDALNSKEGSKRRNSSIESDELTPKNLKNIFQDDNVLDDYQGEHEEDEERSESDRYERAIVAFERRNREITTSGTRDDSNDDDNNTWNESRSGRSRRDEGRGKKRRKIKRRLKRSRRRLGPLVATFIGAVPEQHSTDAAYIGPWVKSMRNESRYAFNKFHLVEDKKSIEVTANGLYMISTQIHYFGELTHYSYWILLTSEGSSNTRKVIKCATVSAVSASEASCYTSIVLPLRRGDRLHIQQQENGRLINLREGHSYVQIMLLSGESPRRRGS